MTRLRGLGTKSSVRDEQAPQYVESPYISIFEPESHHGLFTSSWRSQNLAATNTWSVSSILYKNAHSMDAAAHWSGRVTYQFKWPIHYESHYMAVTHVSQSRTDRSQSRSPHIQTRKRPRWHLTIKEVPFHVSAPKAQSSIGDVVPSHPQRL